MIKENKSVEELNEISKASMDAHLSEYAKAFNKVWNEAIEAAVKEAESKSHILLPLEARIRMLKK